MDKQALRKRVREELKRLNNEQKAIEASWIHQKVMTLDALKEAQTVALFASLPDEPSTEQLLKEISARCKVVIPRIIGEQMEFLPYVPEKTSCGAYNIMEPTDGRAVHPAEIDVAIVPGVAFTSDGIRMGRGKGFYDRYMSENSFRALKIGICFSCQVVEYIPYEKHDIKMDMVIYKK